MNTPIEEAKRYMANAKAILSEKAGKLEHFYTDKKYVKLAGHAAYSAVLVALDSVFADGKKGRKNVEWYRDQLSLENKKMLSYFVSAYDTLHLAMGYDGNPNAKVAKAGLDDAERIIKWVETTRRN
ncbi:DUF5618 family protein [Niabella hirudinis]|uniref:DUF5618 family protein n=1 Tax=Niabella hirudinis TaxID=1285929 RepID=UPI003EBF5CD3